MMSNLDLHNKANKDDHLDLPCCIVSTTALLKWLDLKKGNKYKQTKEFPDLVGMDIGW